MRGETTDALTRPGRILTSIKQHEDMMAATPNDDTTGFVVEEPEHCFACFRLIRPGQTYYLTLEHEV